jgi:methyl-accepting chemotaxis protein
LLVISAFRRKVSQGETPVAVADPCEPATKPPPAAAARLDAEMVDSLEADVSRAIKGVTEAIARANGDVSATKLDLGHIHDNMGELVVAGKGAAAQTLGLAASTEELAATSRSPPWPGRRTCSP